MDMKKLQNMMKQAQKMQAKLQEEISQMRVQGVSGGGMVTVDMDGGKQLLSVRIKPEVVDPDDIEMLQDLIVAAVNDAARQVDDAVNDQLGGLGNMMGGF